MQLNDFEEFEGYIVGKFQENLNTFIGDINNNKNDGITLATIPTTDYFSVPRETKVDRKIYVGYRMESPGLSGGAPYPLVFDLQMSFFVILNNVDKGNETVRSIQFRYGLALQKVINDMSKNKQNGLAIATAPSYPPGLYHFDGAKDNYKKASGVSLIGVLPNC